MSGIFNILTGIYFCGWGLCFLLFSGIMVLMPSDQTEMQTGMLWVVLAMYVVAAAVLITVAVGLFMKRNWARIGAISLAGFALLGGLSASVGTYLMRDVVLDTPEQATILGGMIIFLGLFFGIVPLSMIIFYCLQPAKALFISEAACSKDPDRVPLGLRLLAVYFGSSILGLVSVWFTPDYEAPVVFFWIWLSGDALKFFTAGIAVLHVYPAYGFYNLQQLAWKMALVIYGYYTLNGIYSAVALDEVVLTRMYRFMGDTGQLISVGMMRGFYAMSLLLMIPLLVYIYRKRDYFTN